MGRRLAHHSDRTTAVAPLIFAIVLLAGDSREDPLGIRLVGPVAGVLVLLAFLSFRPHTLVEPDARGGCPPARRLPRARTIDVRSGVRIARPTGGGKESHHARSS